MDSRSCYIENYIDKELHKYFTFRHVYFKGHFDRKTFDSVEFRKSLNFPQFIDSSYEPLAPDQATYFNKIEESTKDNKLLLCVHDRLAAIYGKLKTKYIVFDLLMSLNVDTFLKRKHLVPKTTPTKHFTCLNHVPRTHRLWSYFYFLKYGILEKGLVSKQSKKTLNLKITPGSAISYYDGGITNFKDFFTDEFCKAHQEDVLYLDEDYLYKALGTLDSNITMWTNRNFFTLNGVVSFVNEVFQTPRHRIFLTEKTWIPILNKRPFILNAPPHNLLYLKKLGFKTFDSILDESYDTILNPTDRMKTACESLKTFINRPLQECLKDLKKIETILEHNYQNIISLSEKNKINLNKQVRAYIDKL